MTKTRSTKRALLVSAISLFVCVSMLIGSTYAWFTDSVTSAGNKIVAGKLDVQLWMADSQGNYSDISSSTNPIFGSGSIAQNNNAETLWEPGKTQVAYLQIKNNGNLALKYTVGLDVENVSKDLYKVMKYTITPDAEYDSVKTWDSSKAISVAVGTQAVTDGDTVMKPGDVHSFALSIHMDEKAGNEYQGGEVNFDLTIMATQATVEEDSFDDQYDKDAEYPVIADAWDGTADISWYNANDTEFVISTAEELAGFATMVNSGNSFAGKTVKLNDNLDLKNLQWTPIGNNVNYFKGTFDGQNHIISNMTIDVNTPDADQFAGLFGGIQNAAIKNLTMKDSNITVLGKKVRAAAVVGIADSDKSTPQVVVLNFENIIVDGCDINAEATSGSVLTGGVVGYCYPANMTNIAVSDLTINGKSENNEVRAAAIAGYVCGQNISNNGNTRKEFAAKNFEVKDVAIDAEGYTVFAGGYAPYTYYGYITLEDGTIDNLKIKVDAHEAFVGGLVGYFWRSDNGHNVKNVHVTGIDFDVTTDYLGETRVGGMVGTSQSPNTKYTDCSVSGKIVERCSDSANPVNYHAKVGGFVARTYEYAMQTYTNCIADVDVTASNIAGGFVGNHNSTVSYVNCEAKGDITANIAGGFAGRLTEHGYTTAVTFDGCKASGNVIGTNVAGGFIGSTANHGWAAWVAGNGTGYGKTVTIKDCVAAGTVTSGSAYCAGVVGEAKMADGVEIVLENVTYDTTKPAVYPNN